MEKINIIELEKQYNEMVENAKIEAAKEIIVWPLQKQGITAFQVWCIVKKLTGWDEERSTYFVASLYEDANIDYSDLGILEN